MWKVTMSAMALALVPALSAQAQDASTEIAGDAEAGEAVFRKCMACHAVGEDARNKVGPILNGVVGRDVASVADFSYSGAMEEWGEGKQWTPETLSAFLENPRDTVSGTKMAFPGLRQEEERQDVIAYLATFGDAAPEEES